MKISLIAAVAQNNVIGKDNQLLWHLPDDLKRFKTLTTGKSIIMGRKTFDSIGRALPKRKNIIITRNKNYQPPDKCFVFHSIKAALQSVATEDEVFIIGGAEIYKQTIHLANNLYITHVSTTIDGDAFFPEIDKEKWKIVSEKKHQANEKNEFDYRFVDYSSTTATE